MYGASASKQVDHSSKQTDPTNVPTTQTAPASTQAVPIAVKTVTHYDLGFKACFLLGTGLTGEVILPKDNSTDFYLIEHDGIKYTQKCRKKLPDGMDDKCFKAINGDRIFLQYSFNTDTICYNRKLQNLNRVHHEGWLTDCIGDKLFYSQGTQGEQDWKIVTRQLYHNEESVPEVPSLEKLQLKDQVTL